MYFIYNNSGILHKLDAKGRWMMAELKKTLLFGYSKSSVREVLQEHREQKERYESRIKHLEEINADFKRSIERYQEKELFISEALTEAKRIAKNILADSEVQAEEMVRLTKEDLAERVRNTEAKFKRLEKAKQAIVEHEEFMKVELKQLLTKQMDMIDHIEIGLDDKDGEVQTLINNSQYELEEVRQIAMGNAKIDKDTGKVVHLSSRVSDKTKKFRLDDNVDGPTGYGGAGTDQSPYTYGFSQSSQSIQTSQSEQSNFDVGQNSLETTNESSSDIPIFSMDDF